MNFEDLKSKALSLPLLPGVYIMKDHTGGVIYVGKAKKLKNRVCQYFQDNSTHTPKTKQMVSNIHSFDTIVVASEFEALVLECSLIKQHKPKYNILLKDDKGFPFVRLSSRELYPRFQIVNGVSDDGAEYYGPFGSRGVTKHLLDTIYSVLKLPTCGKIFPRDIGKDRPCLNYHMNQCAGWCQINLTQKEYMETIRQAKHLLQGDYRAVSRQIKQEMLDAAEALKFELAANLRDRLAALDTLERKQNLISGAGADLDVIGFAQADNKACFTVLHFINGNLVDKEYQMLTIQDSPEEVVTALIKQYYIYRGFAPKLILLPFAVEEAPVIAELLTQNNHKKVVLKVPQRGVNTKLVVSANENANEELIQVTSKEQQTLYVLKALGKMLGVSAPERIESFDISNLASTDIVASMVVFCNGKPKKSEYKRFKIDDLTLQDDYASMEQVVRRRFMHYINKDKGFAICPDLLLIDGGISHANIAKQVLLDLGVEVPVFGMVKDDRHRTRALVTPEGLEIRIDGNQDVFSLIGNIQEETHRFAIGYHKKLRSRRLRYSTLDEIPGIGEKRKQLLLKKFKSISNIRVATLKDLERILPKDAANAVYLYFREEKERGE